jgi:flavin-dependent dehydrogenase
MATCFILSALFVTAVPAFALTVSSNDVIRVYGLKDDGTTGFSWVVTEKECVDVLIGRFFPVKPEDLKETLKGIKGDYPHIGDKLLRGGNVTPIPVCHPLGILVCDGYAAVGDSAFMTYAVKGSGISYSIKAGILLARAVEGDTLGQFNTETLWEYQRLFFKETGFGACRIALLKNVLPYFTADEIRELFNSDIFDAGDFNALMENKLEMVMGTQGRTMIKEKIRLIRENVILKEKLTALAMWIGKLTVTEAYFPNKYDKRDAENG